MARAVFDITEDGYLSGIWRADIELHLCWSIVGHRVNQKRTDRQDPEWTAPSWSWASIDGPVTYKVYATLKKRYGHVFDTGSITSETEDFSRASRSVLHLRCSALVACRFCDRPTLPSSWVTDHVAIESNGDEFIRPTYVDCIDDSSSLRDEAIYLLPLIGWVGSTGHVDSLRGIVLRKTTGAVGEYCRIGNFYFEQLEVASHFETSGLSLRDMIHDVGAATAEAACAEVVSNTKDPLEKYVITIV